MRPGMGISLWSDVVISGFCISYDITNLMTICVRPITPEWSETESSMSMQKGRRFPGGLTRIFLHCVL
jgi:hypothetical protein